MVSKEMSKCILKENIWNGFMKEVSQGDLFKIFLKGDFEMDVFKVDFDARTD